MQFNLIKNKYFSLIVIIKTRKLNLKLNIITVMEDEEEDQLVLEIRPDQLPFITGS